MVARCRPVSRARGRDVRVVEPGDFGVDAVAALAGFPVEGREALLAAAPEVDAG